MFVFIILFLSLSLCADDVYGSFQENRDEQNILRSMMGRSTLNKPQSKIIKTKETTENTETKYLPYYDSLYFPDKFVTSIKDYINDINDMLINNPHIKPESVLVLFDWDEVISRVIGAQERLLEGEETQKALVKISQLGVHSRVLTARGHILRGCTFQEKLSLHPSVQRIIKSANLMNFCLPSEWHNTSSDGAQHEFSIVLSARKTFSISSVFNKKLVFSTFDKGVSLMDILRSQFHSRPIEHIFFIDDNEDYIAQIKKELINNKTKPILSEKHRIKTVKCYLYVSEDSESSDDENIDIDNDN